MNMDNFINLCLRTESDAVPLCSEQYPNTNASRLLHAAIGLSTESGEFIDALKKHMFYGKELDIVNLHEELGDMLWYMAIAMSVLETNFTTEMQRVIAKLQTRYPEKFNTSEAIVRNLDTERKVLETPITHYASYNGSAIFIKEADFFIEQAGLKKDWGKSWVPICATSIGDARKKAAVIFNTTVSSIHFGEK
jgi:NTP pyrophosphatase (non-canonical NTP hydrolase)